MFVLYCLSRIIIYTSFKACRGNEYGMGVDKGQDAMPKSQSAPELKTPVDKTEMSDTIVFRSTIPGKVSFRDKKEGTWFVQAICKVALNSFFHPQKFSFFEGICQSRSS